MDLYVLNTAFDTVAIIDDYESFNWTDRYNEAGDFELVLLVTTELITVIQANYYLYFQMSDHLMIIESLEIKTDDEKGNRLVVSGRSLESLLDRRVIWTRIRFTFAESFQNAIIKMVNNSMSPFDCGDSSTIWGEKAAANRQIKNPNFIVKRAEPWDKEPLANQLKMDSIEYWGENLYDIVVDLCKSRDPEVGYKVAWKQSDNTFNFVLYIGEDRSSDNSAGNLPVMFSPYLENIFDTDYYESIKGYKTIALIIGQYPKANDPDTIEDRSTSVFRGSNITTYTGMYRREVYCDARNVPYKDDDNNVYNWDTVLKPALQEEGKKTLNSLSNKKAKTFEGEVDYQTTYEYGVDYSLGDIVDVADIYGHEMKARIVEVTFSDDEEGFSVNPSFEMFGEVIGGE